MKNVMDGSYPYYYPTLDFLTIVFLLLLGTFLECFMMYICFKDNKEIQAIIAMTFVVNILTFVIGLLFVMVLA